MLEVFSDRIIRGSGIDNNSQMLKVARSKLEAREHITVRQGDLNAAPLGDAVECGATESGATASVGYDPVLPSAIRPRNVTLCNAAM